MGESNIRYIDCGVDCIVPRRVQYRRLNSSHLLSAQPLNSQVGRRVRITSAFSLFLALVWASIAVSGCTVRLISDYDDVLDKDVTALQQATETFLNQLDSEVGTPAAAYSANSDFYIKTNASLRTMATRAASQPKSKIVVEQVQALEKTFDDMQQLHKLNGDKGLSSANIANIRNALESQFKSILTLQLALKSHSGVPSSATAPAKNGSS